MQTAQTADHSLIMTNDVRVLADGPPLAHLIVPRPVSQTRQKGQRGFVLITVAASAIALVGVLGMAVDIGRMFITKNETQAFCDAAALAATLELNGTTAGITNAQTAVTNSVNKWNLDTAAVASPTVTFSIASTGPWVSNPSPAIGYLYTRVAATVGLPFYFLPVIVGSTTQNVTSSATAGQIDITSFPRGLAPYSAVSTNTVGPTFGFTIGHSYDIQWPQYNSSRGGCGPGNPDKCFVSPTCADETNASKLAVVNNWQASNSGYWGASSNSIIRQEILDLIQLQAVDVGTNLFPVLSTGTKASEAVYLDERASQDINTSDNTVSAYLANAHNGRRLISVPFLNPVSPTSTPVVGYGLFLLMANGPGPSNYYRRITNGNDPFCALYAGPYIIGAQGSGGGGATGAARVKLVL